MTNDQQKQDVERMAEYNNTPASRGEHVTVNYKPSVEVEGKFSENGLVFATYTEAYESAESLMFRWYAVTNIRVVETTDKVNYTRINGKDERIVK
jgi:hypothetical protein